MTRQPSRQGLLTTPDILGGVLAPCGLLVLRKALSLHGVHFDVGVAHTSALLVDVW